MIPEHPAANRIAPSPFPFPAHARLTSHTSSPTLPTAYTIDLNPLAGRPTCVIPSTTHTVFLYSGKYLAPVYPAWTEGDPA